MVSVLDRTTVQTAAVMKPASLSGDDVLGELEEFYRVRYPDLLRAATAISGGVESGRDAVHDAFVSLVRGRANYSGRGTVEAWAWRALVNAAKKQHRRDNVLPVGSLTDLGQSAIAEPAFDLAAIRAAVARLPERQRTVLFLRYYADLDYEAIAAVLGIRVGTVGAALHTAQKTLRDFLRESQK